MMMRRRSIVHGSSESQTHGRSNFISKKHLKCYHCGKGGHEKTNC